eukprot:1870039-Alexandrium_andersonii.AAC.1
MSSWRDSREQRGGPKRAGNRQSRRLPRGRAEAALGETDRLPLAAPRDGPEERRGPERGEGLSLIHISEPTRLALI